MMILRRLTGAEINAKRKAAGLSQPALGREGRYSAGRYVVVGDRPSCAAGLARKRLAAAAGVSAIQIYIVETGRTLNRGLEKRTALERALWPRPPGELAQAVEERAEIRGVGRITDSDPHRAVGGRFTGVHPAALPRGRSLAARDRTG